MKMSFIDKWIFGDIFSPPDERDKLPPVYGGDAVSPGTAATINCYSMSAANRLIDRFIAERHGERDTDWKREIEYFVNESEITEFTIRAIGIVTASDEKHTYYFDVSQPMEASMNLVKVMTKYENTEKGSLLGTFIKALKIRR
jgi:hypothetical protein